MAATPREAHEGGGEVVRGELGAEVATRLHTGTGREGDEHRNGD